ncbi:hypothetical protein [Terrihabitans sp. B22-R8]|uniref:hypothetical protein n=1 Tax=Terrihabitans sp. B22-R8 TaxID=3425128 RepID=UPI00403C0374
MSDLNALAEALGRARRAYERRPDNDRLYALFLEARDAFTRAQLAHTNAELARERTARIRAEAKLKTRNAAFAKLWADVQPVRQARKRAVRERLPDLFDMVTA